MLNLVFESNVGEVVKLKINRPFGFKIDVGTFKYDVIRQNEILTIVKIEKTAAFANYMFTFFYNNRICINHYNSKQQFESSFEKIICQ